MRPLLLAILAWSTGNIEAAVIHASLEGKIVCGYQGWFRAEGDGSGLGWVHYGPGRKFGPGNCSFDIWPDLSEFAPEERFPSPFRFADGKTADLFSSVHPMTVRRHFRWMREYGIDGAFLQRFGTMLRTAGKAREALDVVLRNCLQSAQAEERSLTLMYDLSGLAPENFGLILADWDRLVREGLLGHECLQHHRDKPLIALWGIGFSDRTPGLDEWEKLLGEFKKRGLAIMLGVPTYWREQKADAIDDPKLHSLLRQADILSPWTVGRINKPESVAGLARTVWQPDIRWCREAKLGYIPVIFPGFSWHNLSAIRGKNTPLDQIPRQGGRFFWQQAVAAKQAGASTLYVAMFDEIDEGTAVMKCGGPRPVGASPFVDLSDTPSDHYLWLTGQAGRMLRREIPESERPPVR